MRGPVLPDLHGSHALIRATLTRPLRAPTQEAEAELVQMYYESLQLQGVFGYSLEQAWQDYKMALMFWPVFVSVWFGSQQIEEVVDQVRVRRPCCSPTSNPNVG